MTNITLRSDIEVDLVKFSATDADVVRAARVSTIGRESLRKDSAQRELIDYLMRNRHGSPFEHTMFTFYIEAPIFVARQHMRHRAGWSYNEESGRYRELEPVFYVPGKYRNLIQVGKPGHYMFEPGTHAHHSKVANVIRDVSIVAYEKYKELLSFGIAREVARMVLPVNIYTRYYATCNARSLMHFLSLRTKDTTATYASHPQEEINKVAISMETIFKNLMPDTHEAFVKHGRVAP